MWNFKQCERQLKNECISGSYHYFLVFWYLQDPKDCVFLTSIALSKQVRMSLSRIVFLPIRCPGNSWSIHIWSLAGTFWSHGSWELGVWMVVGGFGLVTTLPHLPFSFFLSLVSPPQRAAVWPWGCTIKISQSKILRIVLSRWLCLRVALCIWAPKTLFWRNMMDVLKTSFRKYMTSNYSAFFLLCLYPKIS